MIDIVIVDDQVLLCESLGFILNNDDDINVVGFAYDGQSAIELVESKKPDIVLMDIDMPNMNGVLATKKIKEKNHDTKVIILTTFEDEGNIMESFIVGADGYIVKNINHRDLIMTVKSVYNGLCVIDKSVKEIMISRFRGLFEYKSVYEDKLSSVEVDIIKHISKGMSNKEIGYELNYSEGTIKNKISKILSKLEMQDRMQLAIFAIENGIV